MKAIDSFDCLPDYPELSNPDGRSRLFSRKPERFGQPMQESLISFIVGTSRAHSVNPRRLVTEVLGVADPEIGRLAYAGFFRNLSRTINGLGPYAARFVSVMEQLTGADGLYNLTMLPWRNLFPLNGQGMLATHPRWCPECLHLQRLNGHEPHFPLAWALDAFKVCTIHRRPLEECCQHCGRRQPFIPRYPDLGICSECMRPLAAGLVPKAGPHLEPSNTFEQWVSRAIGGMIGAHSTGQPIPAAEDFRRFVQMQVDRRTAGNQAAFCRALGFTSRALHGWLNKGDRPSITQLLCLCYGLDVHPTDILLRCGDSYFSEGSPRSTRKLKNRLPCPRLTGEQREAVWSKLAGAVLAGDGKPLSIIAADMALPARYLRYWFPELCSRLSAQYRSAANLKSRLHQAAQSRRVEEIVHQLRNAGVYPSRRKVNGQLRKERMALAQSHLLLAYCKALKN